MKQKERIKAILFDLDGVLIDSYLAWYHQFNDTLKYFGHKPISEKVFRKHWGQSTEDDVRIFMPERTVDEVRKYFENHYHEYMDYLQINNETKNVLRKLAKMKLKIGCVTNSHRNIVKKILVNKRINNFFQILITADDVKRPKPAPDMLLKACRRLRVLPQETIFVGDTKTDIKAGNNAGCLVIGYRTKADMMAQNLEEILSMVNKMV